MTGWPDLDRRKLRQSNVVIVLCIVVSLSYCTMHVQPCPARTLSMKYFFISVKYLRAKMFPRCTRGVSSSPVVEFCRQWPIFPALGLARPVLAWPGYSTTAHPLISRRLRPGLETGEPGLGQTWLAQFSSGHQTEKFSLSPTTPTPGHVVTCLHSVWVYVPTRNTYVA